MRQLEKKIHQNLKIISSGRLLEQQLYKLNLFTGKGARIGLKAQYLNIIN